MCCAAVNEDLRDLSFLAEMKSRMKTKARGIKK